MAVFSFFSFAPFWNARNSDYVRDNARRDFINELKSIRERKSEHAISEFSYAY